LKPPKIMDVKLNGRYDARFTLEFAEDEQGDEYGTLTVPYVKWLSLDEPVVWERVHEISGALLQCIEKQYFDNNVIAIPVKGYPIIVEIEDIIQKIAPEEICNQMISGTFKIADDADKSIYGNLPAKINNELAKTSKRPLVKHIKDPSSDAMIEEFYKNILPKLEQHISRPDGPREPEFSGKVFKDEKGKPYQGERVIGIPDCSSATMYQEIIVFYRNGKLHGDPAIIYPDGLAETWEDGVFVRINDLPYAQRERPSTIL